MAQREAFRSLLAANRCLVPASRFYERKGGRRDKTACYIHPKTTQFFAFTGLYDVWAKPNGEELYTFTIITKQIPREMVS